MNVIDKTLDKVKELAVELQALDENFYKTRPMSVGEAARLAHFAGLAEKYARRLRERGYSRYMWMVSSKLNQ